MPWKPAFLHRDRNVQREFERLGDHTIDAENRRVCTSSTRPASPYAGMQIFETDTQLSYIWDGAAWVEMGRLGAPASRTPTLTNITLGTGGVNQQWYTVDGKICEVWGSVKLGTGGALTGSPNVNLPFTSKTRSDMVWVGPARYHDPGIRLWVGVCYIMSNQSIIAFVQAQGGTGNLSGTEPFTWGVNDELSYRIEYEIA